MNVFKLFFVVIPALVLIVAGIWVRPCLFIGLALLAIVLTVALVQQIVFKHTLEMSDDPVLEPFADAACSDDWERIVEMTYKIAEEQTGKDAFEQADEDGDTEEDRQE